MFNVRLNGGIRSRLMPRFSIGVISNVLDWDFNEIKLIRVWNSVRFPNSVWIKINVSVRISFKSKCSIDLGLSLLLVSQFGLELLFVHGLRELGLGLMSVYVEFSRL